MSSENRLVGLLLLELEYAYCLTRVSLLFQTDSTRLMIKKSILNIFGNIALLWQTESTQHLHCRVFRVMVMLLLLLFFTQSKGGKSIKRCVHGISCWGDELILEEGERQRKMTLKDYIRAGHLIRY